MGLLKNLLYVLYNVFDQHKLFSSKTIDALNTNIGLCKRTAAKIFFPLNFHENRRYIMRISG